MSSNYKILTIFFLVFVSSKVWGQSVQRKVAFPNVVGLTLKEAQIVLQKYKLNIGAIIYNPGSKNIDTLIVYKQNPSTTNEKGDTNYLNKNNLIDVWLINSYSNLDTLKRPKTSVVIQRSSNR